MVFCHGSIVGDGGSHDTLPKPASSPKTHEGFSIHCHRDCSGRSTVCLEFRVEQRCTFLIPCMPGATPVCYPHHEQLQRRLPRAVLKFWSLGCVVTTGPAASNTMTGLLSAWQDSTPVLDISVQTRKQLTSYGRSVRQVGSQEINILDVVCRGRTRLFLTIPKKYRRN